MADDEGVSTWREICGSILCTCADVDCFDLVKKTLLEEILFTEEDKKEKAQRFLCWAKGRQHLKVISAEVPLGFLPNGHKGVLHDIRVFSKHGPDDAIYDANTDIREKVARGNTLLEILDGPHAGTTCVIYALKKFTGGLGDDDDRDKGDNFTWKRYFSKPIEEAKSVIATRKANGEAAHLSCIQLDGQHIICAGSKNVHMLLREKGDIDLYTEPRYRVASIVAKTVMESLGDMGPDERKRLLDFLCATKYTAVFEILSPESQHVEDLSHLKRPELRFITWTSTDIEPPIQGQVCCMAPHVAIEIAKALGLTTVPYEVLPISDVEDRMKQIRQGYGYEGEVLYFLDSDHEVIGLLKKKTIWYILCRAIREKAKVAATQWVKSSSTFSVSKTLHKVDKRIEDIQLWLGLDMETVRAWKRLAEKYVRWLINKLETGDLCQADVNETFPQTWKKFLCERGETDKLKVSWSETEESLECADGAGI